MRDQEVLKEYRRRYYKKNRAKILERTRAYIVAHPEVYQRSHKNRLFKEHSITEVDYRRQLYLQDERCAICREKEQDKRDLSIDHDHACCFGEKSCPACNRGLLCNACNKKLAVIEDTKFVEAALKYLHKWAAPTI